MAGSPKNHPIQKENHLNQTSMVRFHVNFPGCIRSGVWKKRAAWGKSDLSEMDCKLQDPLGQQVVMIATEKHKAFLTQQKGFAVFAIHIPPKQSVLNSQSKCQPKKQHHLSEEKEQNSLAGNPKDPVEDHPMTGKWLVTKLNKSPKNSGCSLSNWPNFMAYKCGWSDHHFTSVLGSHPPVSHPSIAPHWRSCW